MASQFISVITATVQRCTWLVVLAVGLSSTGSAVAQESHWSSFRGAGSTGFSADQVLTSKQDVLEKIWEVRIPGSGYSTPVANSDSVFVTTSYQSEKHKTTRLLLIWVSAVSVTLLGLIFLYRSIAHSVYKSSQAFFVSVTIWLLTCAVIFGWDLFACQNATFRIWVLTSGVVAMILLGLSETLFDNRSVAIGTVFVGVSISIALFFTFPFWPAINRLEAATIIALSLLAPASVSAIVFLGLKRDRSGLAKKLSRISRPALVAFPFTILLLLGWRGQGSRFWSVQPTNPLELPPVVFKIVVAIGIWFLLILFLGMFSRKCRALLNFYGALFLVGLLAAASPALINRFQYLKYQFVRGEVDSILGTNTAFIFVGILFVAPLLLTLIPLKEELRESTSGRSRNFPGLHCLAMLAATCGLTGFVYSNLLLQPSGQVHSVVSINAARGEIQWIRDGIVGGSALGNAFNSHATPSPVLVDDSIIAYFGSTGAFRCDARNGSLAWVNTNLPYSSGYGPASSICATDKYVFVQSDALDEVSYLRALAIGNGRPAWNVERKSENCWRSPIVIRCEYGEFVCLWGRHHLDLYDAETAELKRRIRDVECGEGDPVVSPVFDGRGIWLYGAEYGFFLSVEQLLGGEHRDYKLDFDDGYEEENGEDDYPMLEPAAAMDLQFTGPTCSTPSCSSSTIVSVSDMGEVVCIDKKTRRINWTADIGTTMSSPMIAGQFVYAVNSEGKIHVFPLAEANGVSVCQIELNEEVQASPIAVDGVLYVRTKTRLCAFRKAETQANSSIP